MADSSAVRAGRAFVEILGDDVKLQQTLKRVQAQFAAWGRAMTAVGTKALASGTAILAPLIAAARQYATMGAEMAETAEKMGVSVEAVSQLSYAAGQTEVSLDDLGKGVRKMASTVFDAASGLQEANEYFADLGISVADLKSLTPDKQFEAIADAMSRLSSPTEKSALAMKIFGRSGVDLLPLLNQGADGIEALRARADRLGLTMSTNDAQGALEFDHRLSDLWASVRMGVFEIGGALAPVLRAVTLAFTDAAAAARKMVSQHQGAVVGAALLGTSLAAAGIGLIAFGQAFAGASAALGVASGLWTALGTVIAAAETPLAIVTAGLGGAAAAMLYLTDAGAAVRTYLAKVFGQLGTDVVTTFGAIRAALASGEWSAAAKVLWAMLKLEFVSGVGGLTEVWDEFRFAMVEIWQEATADVATAWLYLMEYLTSFDGLVTAWTGLWDFWKNGWKNALDASEDSFQEWWIRQRAEGDIRDRFSTDTVLNKSDADYLASKQIVVRSDLAREKAAQEADSYGLKGIHKDNYLLARSQQLFTPSEKQEIIDHYRKQFVGHSLNEGQLNRLIDEEIQARLGQLHAERNSSDAADAARYSAQQALLEKNFEASHPKLAEMRSARDAIARERSADSERHARDLQAHIDELQKERDALRAQFNSALSKASGGPGSPATPKFKAPDKDTAADFNAQMSRAASAGTFNASALFGFGSRSDAADKIARNTERANQILEELRKAASQGRGFTPTVTAT